MIVVITEKFGLTQCSTYEKLLQAQEYTHLMINSENFKPDHIVAFDLDTSTPTRLWEVRFNENN